MKLERSKYDSAAKVFDELGGRKVEHSDGVFWLFSSGSVLLEVEPFERRTQGGLNVGIDVSMSNSELSRIVNRICGKSGQARQQFEWRQWQRRAPTEEAFEITLREVMSEALTQTQTVDISDLAARFATELPSNRSLDQLMHLACLAYRGDLVALESYRDGMQLGKRFGFVPMIKVNFLDRAIKEALK